MRSVPEILPNKNDRRTAIRGIAKFAVIATLSTIGLEYTRPGMTDQLYSTAQRLVIYGYDLMTAESQDDKFRAIGDLAGRSVADTIDQNGFLKSFTAIVAASDSHCHPAFPFIINALKQRLETEYAISAGDWTSYGSIVEKSCTPNTLPKMFTVLGNHDSRVTQNNLENAGVKVLSGASADIEGIQIYGKNDPRSNIYGGARQNDRRKQYDHKHYSKQLKNDICELPQDALVILHWRRYLEQALLPSSPCLDGKTIITGHEHAQKITRYGSAKIIQLANVSAATLGLEKPTQPMTYYVLFLDKNNAHITYYMPIVIDGLKVSVGKPIPIEYTSPISPKTPQLVG